jgi:hypothetical protein
MTMAEQKMGTHYVRELCQTFRDIGGEGHAEGVKDQLSDIAGRLEPLAKKLYFKTQKGTSDAKGFVEEMEGLKGKLAECKDAAEAQSLCEPFFGKIEKVIHHVKTMKVRMT